MKIRYEGSAGQVNNDVGAATGDGALEPGKVYDLPASLAKNLAACDVRWTLVGGKKSGDEAASDDEAGAAGEEA